ncbi:MAG: hypothetical protein N3E45_05210 [Oscillatoriaceae bacterium SKW80]|nr:hypothetical protein [Oscillatoriaceae bacterium SKYG93]MCX8120213.1 hypothetical protein [Oscillatoriaceae bacterium SKW80]MDW8453139.1 hypothetical protein [Oscillatoriaceae cyanobacterium SKYGB_i_bin93]HIK28949.1 hypothetical protein [Oscillatoriaceae cyanobacterium M7585_C2015_266]
MSRYYNNTTFDFVTSYHTGLTVQWVAHNLTTGISCFDGCLMTKPPQAETHQSTSLVV